MENKTRNLKELLEYAKTKREAVIVQNITCAPYITVTRAYHLMEMLIEKYFENADSIQDLIFDLQTAPRKVEAIIFTVFEQLEDVSAMLSEIQMFKPEEGENKKDCSGQG